MSITDKTRKILWGRSGNRCAMCRRELIVDPTPADDESVVGDECHIISGKDNGPRNDAVVSPDRLDEPDNLILLCRVHHKMVDDQDETYTVDVLRSLKENHERWVSSSLTGNKPIPPVRVKRIRENIPTHLMRLTSGQAVLAIVDGVSAYAFEHDELQSAQEVDLVGGFLQEAQDYGELSSDLEAGSRIQAAFEIGVRLEGLKQAGFWVFGEREVRRLEGGIGPPTPFTVAILNILRGNNPEIIKLDLTMFAEEDSTKPTPDRHGE